MTKPADVNASAPARSPDSLFARDTIDGLWAAMEEASSAAHAALSGDVAAGSALAACEQVARAVELSDAGKVEEARLLLDEVLATSDDPRLLYVGYQFHFRIGDHEAAERLIHRRLRVALPESAEAARAWNNLGLLCFMRKDLDGAEAQFGRALEIDRRIGHEEGIARDLGNLSLVPESRGDFVDAERLNREALAIAERIGADSIIATRLCNLGEILLARGQRAEARGLLVRAAAAFGALGIEKHRAHCARLCSEIDGLDRAS